MSMSSVFGWSNPPGLVDSLFMGWKTCMPTFQESDYPKPILFPWPQHYCAPAPMVSGADQESASLADV